MARCYAYIQDVLPLEGGGRGRRVFWRCFPSEVTGQGMRPIIQSFVSKHYLTALGIRQGVIAIVFGRHAIKAEIHYSAVPRARPNDVNRRACERKTQVSNYGYDISGRQCISLSRVRARDKNIRWYTSIGQKSKGRGARLPTKLKLKV